MKCAIFAAVVCALAVLVLSENCQSPADCSLEACANNGTVECDKGVCTCGAGSATSACVNKDQCVQNHKPCHEHGHGHHADWHCLDGQCRCI